MAAVMLMLINFNGFHFFLYFIRPQNQPMANFEVFFTTFLLFYADTMMIIEDRLIHVLHCMIYFNIYFIILLQYSNRVHIVLRTSNRTYIECSRTI